MRLSFTERASQAVLARAREAEVEGWILRIAVVAGGGNGLPYDPYFIENAGPEDPGLDGGPLRIAVDRSSAALLDGTVVDIPRGPGFRFDNPRARKTCSCGASFET